MTILKNAPWGGPIWLSAALALAQGEAKGSDTDPSPVRLKEVSVTATRTERPVEEIPATVTVKIEQELVTDIKDLTRYEPGVSVRTSPARFRNSGFNIEDEILLAAGRFSLLPGLRYAAYAAPGRGLRQLQPQSPAGKYHGVGALAQARRADQTRGPSTRPTPSTRAASGRRRTTTPTRHSSTPARAMRCSRTRISSPKRVTPMKSGCAGSSSEEALRNSCNAPTARYTCSRTSRVIRTTRHARSRHAQAPCDRARGDALPGPRALRVCA